MLTFEIGRNYTRPDVKELAGLPRDAKGGNWDTGLVLHDGEFLIFANVGTEGRTGHNYDNCWEDRLLRWCHKNGSHLGWPGLKRLLEEESVVHIFWRNSNTLPFEYAGVAKAVEVRDTSPVEILWSLDTAESHDAFVQSPEQVPSGEYREGSVRRVQVNAYERDRAARQACIDHFGAVCVVCDLRFGERYGPLGVGFIHVHHLVPLSEIGSSYKINPIHDLRPICPNCHAMLHRRRPPFSIEEIRKILRD